jgi:hypothetical protein
MNDGVGNSKNCESMWYSHGTPPSMISGVRESAVYAVRAGFKFIQFFEPEEEMAKCVDAYMKSLRPVHSPLFSKWGIIGYRRKREERCLRN